MGMIIVIFFQVMILTNPFEGPFKQRGTDQLIDDNHRNDDGCQFISPPRKLLATTMTRAKLTPAWVT